MVLAAWFLWASDALAQACAAPTTVALVGEAVQRAEIAIDGLDVPALEAAVAEAESALRCVAEPVGSDSLARWYRARAVDRFSRGDAEGAVANFRAAKALQPAYVLGPGLGPPLQQAYASAEPSPETRTLPAPPEGWIVIDGKPASAAPVDRPYVVQWFGRDGGVRSTSVVAAGEHPSYPAAPAPVPTGRVRPAPAPVAPEPVARGHASRTLAIAGLASGVAAGAGIAYAAVLEDQVLSSDQPSSELQALVARNRVVGWSASALGVGALGLGVGAVVVGRW